MTIAITTAYSSSGDWYIAEIVSHLAKKFPQHKFIYIFNRPFNVGIISSTNITAEITGSETKYPLLWTYWYNYKMTAVLQKHKADVLVCAGGICSLRTKIPQCLILQDLAFLYAPQFISKGERRFFKRNTPKYLAKANRLVTVSRFSKTSITDTYKFAAEKTDVVHAGINKVFGPIDEAEKVTIKEKYAEGKEYFLYSGTIASQKNLINLLKAFSFFKKRQKSNMLLLIAVDMNADHDEFINGLKTFKFRHEVKSVGPLPASDLALVFASAYAFVYPSGLEDPVLPALEAMQCGVPVITGNSGVTAELCGDAALYADPGDYSEMADKMMLLFKDESRKKELIEKAIKQAVGFNPENAANQLWQSILKCFVPVN